MKKAVSVILILSVVFCLFSCSKEEKKPLYSLDSGKISVWSLEACDGLFVEKGGSNEVKSAATIVVKNNSDKMLEYGFIVFRVNDIERAEFSVSALPPGEECVVMETTARLYKEGDTYSYNEPDSVYTYCDAATERSGIVLKTDGSEISVTNSLEKPATVGIVYKYFRNGKYYGGIAFRGKMENVGSGQTVTKTSSRFTSDCRIVNITVE